MTTYHCRREKREVRACPWREIQGQSLLDLSQPPRLYHRSLRLPQTQTDNLPLAFVLG